MIPKKVNISNIYGKPASYICACNPTCSRSLTLYAFVCVNSTEGSMKNFKELLWKIYIWDNEHTTAENITVSHTFTYRYFSDTLIHVIALHGHAGICFMMGEAQPKG